ncbi:MAG: hypothetical protein AB7P20_18410 [Rhizobiaceae bacterium]
MFGPGVISISREATAKATIDEVSSSMADADRLRRKSPDGADAGYPNSEDDYLHAKVPLAITMSIGAGAGRARRAIEPS